MIKAKKRERKEKAAREEEVAANNMEGANNEGANNDRKPGAVAKPKATPAMESNSLCDTSDDETETRKGGKPGIGGETLDVFESDSVITQWYFPDGKLIEP